MHRFHSVTLNREVNARRPQCAGGGSRLCRPAQAMTNMPAAPPATLRLRKVHTGMSASAIFMIGQFNPQPSVSPASSSQVERGSVCWPLLIGGAGVASDAAAQPPMSSRAPRASAGRGRA